MKKLQKMNLQNIKNVLSRDEMKKIMAGSSGAGGCGKTGDDCGGVAWAYCCSGRCVAVGAEPIRHVCA